jgi:hypothetical protein
VNLEPQYIKGESHEMRCFTEGIPRPTLKWYLNDEEIDAKDQTDFYVFNDGQSLRVPSVTRRTAGEYSCVASSRAGEARLEQRVVQVEAPQVVKTNLFALEQTEREAAEKVVVKGATVNLTCQARGNPTPTVKWMLDGLAVDLTEGSQYRVAEGGQTLEVRGVGPAQEGRYMCTVSNLGGSQVRHCWLRIGAEAGGFASFYDSDIAVPVIIAVSVSLVLVLIVVILIRLCVTSCRTWKTPPSPPTPRLTQYELPEEGQETESCRLTLSRGGSPYQQSMAPSQAGGCHGCGGCQGTCHQCSACHYNYNGLYGCQGGTLGRCQGSTLGGSVLGVRGMDYCHTPLSLAPSHSPGSQALSDLTQYGQLGLLATVPGGGPMPGYSTLGRRAPLVAPQPLYPTDLRSDMRSDLRSDVSQASAEF